jgi:hypothetical protein
MRSFVRAPGRSVVGAKGAGFVRWVVIYLTFLGWRRADRARRESACAPC